MRCPTYRSVKAANPVNPKVPTTHTVSTITPNHHQQSAVPYLRGVVPTVARSQRYGAETPYLPGVYMPVPYPGSWQWHGALDYLASQYRSHCLVSGSIPSTVNLFYSATHSQSLYNLTQHLRRRQRESRAPLVTFRLFL